MVDAKGFGERLRIARAKREIHGRVSYREIAEAVAERTGRATAHRDTSVGRWIQGDSFPDVPSIWALAEIFGVDPGWLAFGDACQAPGPTLAAADVSAAAVRALASDASQAKEERRRA